MKKTILIVDDDPIFLKKATEVIEENGYISEKFESADLAIKHIEKGLQYDLAMIDHFIPAKGIEHHGGRLVAMVSKKENPKIPIIMASGWPPNLGEIPEATYIYNKDHLRQNRDSLRYHIDRYLNPTDK